MKEERGSKKGREEVAKDGERERRRGCEGGPGRQGERKEDSSGE